MWRAQSAVEMLMTYSWALLIIALFVAIIFVVSGSRAPSQYIGSQCTIVPVLPCIQSVISGYSSLSPITFTMAFNNNLGTALQFPTNAINITTSGLGSSGSSSYLGSCLPAFVNNGGEVICTVQISGSVEPAIGSQVTVPFTISYNICNGKSTSSCTTSTYKTTGQAIQNLANSGVSLYKLTLVSAFNSFIDLNGVTYISGSNVLLSGSTYTIFAIPVSSNYKFSLWKLTAVGNTIIGTNTAANTTLQLGGNSTLTANFIYVGPPTTTVPISTSTITTTTSTSTSTTSTSTTTTSTTTSTSTTSTSTTSTSTTTTSVVPPHLDVASFKGGCCTSSNTQTTSTFSTNNVNDLFLVIFFNDGGSGKPTIKDTNTLTWTEEYGGSTGVAGECGAYWVYYSKPGKKVNGDAVTGNMVGATYTAVQVLAVVNANGFDPNSNSENSAVTASASSITTYVTTTNTDDEEIGTDSTCHSASSSWTGLQTLQGDGDLYGTSNDITTKALSGNSFSVTAGLDVGIMVFSLSP